MEELNIKKSLRDLKQNTESILKKAVITDILSQGDNEEIESYIKDLLEYGCVSGIVSDLIYYNDTDRFFTLHHNEILELLEQAKESGEMPIIEMNSNNLSWFAYEEITRQLVNELKLEF